MITKKSLILHIDKFPDEFTMDELIEKLIFVDKLEKRIELSKEDKTISEADLENEMETF